MHSEQRWENQLAMGWSISDLDVVEIRGAVAEGVRRGRMDEPASREPADLLRGLGVLRYGVLFRSATVLLGDWERVEVDVPQFLLCIARFRGNDKMRFLDNRNSTVIPIRFSRTRYVSCNVSSCPGGAAAKLVPSNDRR